MKRIMQFCEKIMQKIKISLVKCNREHSYTTGVSLNEQDFSAACNY